MKTLRDYLFIGLFLASCVHAGNIFVLSGTQSGLTAGLATSMSSDAFGASNSFTVSPAAAQVLAHPTANRYYVFSKSGSQTIQVVDGATLATLNRFDLGQGEAAAVSPDGRRLVVLGGTVQILDITTPNASVIASNIDAGLSPVDVAISMDSTRAFVLSSQSGRLTAIDLLSNTANPATVSITPVATGVAVAPNGLVYVTTTNLIYEIDGRTMTVRGTISLNGRPGKLVFSGDGRLGMAANQLPVTGMTAWIFDLGARATVGTVPVFGIPPVTFDQVFFAGTKGYAISRTAGRLYEFPIASPNGITESLISLTAVVAGALSEESPAPRYLYVATGGSVVRIDLTTTPPQVAGSNPIPAIPAYVSYATQASTGAPTTLLQFNNNQGLALGATSLPFVVRALDALGRPVMGIPITFSTASGGLLQNPSAVTNSDGYTASAMVAPQIPGLYSVIAQATTGAAQPATFTFSAGTGAGGGGGGIGGIAIKSGNGQIVTEQSLTTELLLVVVKDIAGNVVPNASITFSLAAGLGTLNPTAQDGTLIGVPSCSGNICTATTNEKGETGIGFLATQVTGGSSYAQSTISASTAGASATFTVTTVLGMLPGGQAASPPVVEMLKPDIFGDRLVTGKAGDTLVDAIKVRVTVASGPQSGQGIPGVGIKATTGLEATAGPTAICPGDALSDTSGVISCNLTFGGKTGDIGLTVTVGSYRILAPLNLRVLPGDPGRITIVQGNNQGGNPGQTLPLAFVAAISDNFGNILVGAAAQWEVVTPNSITLTNMLGVTDFNGRVSALGRLGAVPGTNQVRVRSGNVVGTFIFSVNVVLSRLEKVSGDGQVAQINTAFSQPLTVRALDDKGAAIPGIAVSFVVASGSATLSASSAVANAQGQASVNVTAGGTAGPITVNASTGNQTVSFSLTSRLPGPSISATSFANAASGQPGMAPCGLVTISGAGIAPGIQNVVPVYLYVDGSLPLAWQGVEVLIENTAAPILQVGNVNGIEFVTIQAPCELAAPSTVNVTVRVRGGNTSVSGVQVMRAQPGIFETTPASSLERSYAILHRPDGTMVTPNSPALRGEILKMYVTGLGLVSPAASTNKAGVSGQAVAASLIVGVSDEGTRVVSAEYMPGMIGVYVVAFELPTTAVPGQYRSLQLAADNGGGNYVFGRSVIAAVQ